MLVRLGIRIGRILLRLIGLRLGLLDLSYRSWNSTSWCEPEFTEAVALSHDGTDAHSANVSIVICLWEKCCVPQAATGTQPVFRELCSRVVSECLRQLFLMANFV